MNRWAVILCAAFATAGSAIAGDRMEMRVGPSPGTASERAGRLEDRASSFLRFLTDNGTDSARVVDDLLGAGQELWHVGDDDSLVVIVKDYTGGLHVWRPRAAVTTEADPVFVAWKPTYVVIGTADSSLARTGGIQKSLAIDPGFTNSFTVIQNFAQGLTTEYRSNELGAPPGSADLNTAFGSSLADGYPGFFYEITGDVLYLVARGNSGWWRLPMTKVP